MVGAWTIFLQTVLSFVVLLVLTRILGKQQVRITRVEDVCVVDFNGVRKALELKFDAHTVPYFVFKEKTEFKEEKR